MKKPLLLSALLLSFAAQAQTTWQQHVDTKIDVTLDDKTHVLNAFETFEYTNNSPDTLQILYIHLWPNAYKNDRTQFCEQKIENGDPDFYYSTPKQKGYIDSLDFKVNGIPVYYLPLPGAIDIARIKLPSPLYPGSKITVSTPFRVKIPKVFSRLGHTGQAYFISQWFPKPAVYDQRGWHPIPYLDQGEFFSEYGSYDVSITLPQNYIVMATGNCAEETENQWLDSLAAAQLPKSDTLYVKSWPKSATTVKTLHYHEDNIHDFAWFADKRWIVRKDTVTNAGDGHTVTTYVAYLPYHKKYWKKGTEYLKETVLHYGKWVGTYPYKTIKAVEGDMIAGGGMEYPTVTIIDKAASASLKTVVVHEAGHNWFYGLLGSNERDHAWMDEGINTFFEQKTIKELNANDTSSKHKPTPPYYRSATLEEIVSMQLAATNNDQAIEQTSTAFAEINYGLDVYQKTAMLLRWLQDYMGEANFIAGMHAYFDEWHYRHPYPEDFKKVMQQHTSKDISWFFNGALTTDKKIDFRIKNASTKEDGLSVSVKNRSNFAAPVKIDAYQKDSLIGSVWSAPFMGDTTVTIPGIKDYTKVILGAGITDFKTANNSYKSAGLFRHGGFKLKLGAGLNYGYKEKAWLMPALGYNKYDGVMLGGLLHNFTWPQTAFRFAVAPVYAFGSKQLTGAATIGKYFYPKNSFVKELHLQADGKTFDFDKTSVNITSPLYTRFIKIAPELGITFREGSLRSPVTRTLTIKGYYIREGNFDFNLNPNDSLYYPSVINSNQFYGKLRYIHRNDRTINPFSYNGEMQIGAQFIKLNIEGKLRIDYNVKGKSMYVRAFAGKYIGIGNNNTDDSRYYLNTTYTGINDYLYDQTYLGRTEQTGFFSKQISVAEGGFKVPTNLYNSPIGRSDNWMFTVNLETDIPVKKFPFRLFLDVGSFANAKLLTPGGNSLLYDGGISLHLAKDILCIYLPFITSPDFKDYLKSMYPKNKLTNSIAFTLNLQNINWLKAPGDILGFLH